jgi:predicted peptidase
MFPSGCDPDEDVARGGFRDDPVIRRTNYRAQRRVLEVLTLAITAFSCKGDPRPAEPAVVRELARELAEGRVAKPGIDTPLVYRLFVPHGYEASKDYPLILFLHGSGAEGTDNRRQLNAVVRQLIDRANAHESTFVLIPQCPNDKWITGEHRRKHVNYRQSERKESDGLQLVLIALDEVQMSYPIDPARIYVSGFSAGGAGTWDLVTRHPERGFAAAIPMTGNNDPSLAHRIAKLPIWAFHGSEDAVSPPQNTREMLQALRALGSPVRYTEYEGIGHGIASKPFADPRLFTWLFAQRAPAAQSQ